VFRQIYEIANHYHAKAYAEAYALQLLLYAYAVVNATTLGTLTKVMWTMSLILTLISHSQSHGLWARKC